jgi:hypothetical protein
MSAVRRPVKEVQLQDLAIRRAGVDRGHAPARRLVPLGAIAIAAISSWAGFEAVTPKTGTRGRTVLIWLKDQALRDYP